MRSFGFAKSWLCENIPICLCGNKIDSPDRKVRARQIQLHRRKNLPYFELSARSNYNFEKPFLWLSRRLLGDPVLCFVEAPALRVPDVVLEHYRIVEMEQALQQASELPLPDSDDE
eukprot:m.263200 g.263200  ORF g.263200 m.263200 type:complete len:116 (-) comp54634_c0_seq9:867-1214(-)